MADSGPSDDRAWFRSHVDPILDAEPVADAWPEVAARVGTERATATPDRHGGPRRWLAAAAVLLAVAAVTTVVVLGRDDRPDRLTVGAGEATGWYVPEGLPEGWDLVSAMVVDGSRCDGASQRWKAAPERAEPDGTRPAIELAFTGCSEVPADPGLPGPKIGPRSVDSFVAPAKDDPTHQVVRWEDEGGLWEVTGEGVAGDQLLAAAQAIAADPVATDPPLPGFEPTGSGTSGDDDPDGPPTVSLALRSPTGEIVTYALAAPGHGPPLTPFTSDVDRSLADQPLGLRRRGSIPVERFARGAQDRSGYLFGSWPGADVLLPEQVRPDRSADEPPKPAEAEALVDAVATSLRPASAEAWRAFLATAQEGADPRLRTSPTLAALGDPQSGPTGATSPTTGPTDRPPTTPTVATSTTTIAPTPGTTPGSVVSGPGVLTPRDEEWKQATPLEDLDIRLELASDTVFVGQPVAGTLIVRNRTDDPIEFGECSRSPTKWGLIPAATPERSLPDRRFIDCYGNQPNVGPRQTVRFPLDWVRPAGFLAQRPSKDGWSPRGTLPGGDYLAVVEIPGRTSDLRLSIPVTVPDPPCETSDADVEAYLRHSIEGAKAVAAERGDEIRLASVDGKPTAKTDDLRCGRINIDIDASEVVNAVRY